MVNGAVNGELYLAYIRRASVPALKPGDVGVRETIEAAGAKFLFLPPDGPGYNPIEQAFGKFKRSLQTAKARTIEALWEVCGELIERVIQTECRNDIRHAGYRYV